MILKITKDVYTHRNKTELQNPKGEIRGQISTSASASTSGGNSASASASAGY
jgi:hypothetical protein